MTIQTLHLHKDETWTFPGGIYFVFSYCFLGCWNEEEGMGIHLVDDPQTQASFFFGLRCHQRTKHGDSYLAFEHLSWRDDLPPLLLSIHWK
jgi:hypothetical protein